jgi:hypothetical protein
VICGWKLVDSVNACGGAGPCTFTTMSQDSNAHTGSASMSLSWSTDFSNGPGGAAAATDSAFCVQIGPGVHPASFWYIGDSVSMGASFYQGADCTGTVTNASLGDSGASAWKQVSGVLIAPTGTQSTLFSLDVSAWCDYASGCSAAANFDDLDVESGTVTTPTISSFTPTSGPVGTSVDILGANFTGASEVAFNGVAASFTVDSDSAIHATVPAGAATGPISVTTPNGTGRSDSPFGIPPTISSFTPTCGPAGASIDILGSGFTGATDVSFTSAWYGTLPATFTVDSDSVLHAIVPSAASFGPITISTPAGAATSSAPFRGPCDSPPLLNSLTPNSGPVGTSVDLGGHYFTGATSVKFNGTEAAFTVDSDSQIHATLPAGATTGPVSITTPNGTTSNLTFTVTQSPPTITSLTPSSGAVGTSVSISGGGFSGASSVKFNGTAASYTVNSSTSITAVVPGGATSGPISITTPYGTGTSASSFTVIAAPTIASFTPNQGPVGTRVTIHGSNLAAVSNVKLGTNAAGFTGNSPTQITATVPSIAHGNYKWSVTNPAGIATSATYFHVIQTTGQMHVRSAEARRVTGVASVHASLRYDDATLSWHGSFRAVWPDGAVTARGRVVDRPRQVVDADWLITRTLTTRAGTLRFRISGPFKTPTARLHWLIVGGTGAYAALQGHGIDVERAHETTATAVMRGVPAP